MASKKELIKEYKMNPPQMGIFRITNKINNKIYLIASKNLPATYNRFPATFIIGNYFIRDIQKDFDEFGQEAFEYDTLDVLERNDDLNYDYTDDLNELLKLWVDKLEPFNEKGYHTKK
jgi:hypothetical protein